MDQGHHNDINTKAAAPGNQSVKMAKPSKKTRKRNKTKRKRERRRNKYKHPNTNKKFGSSGGIRHVQGENTNMKTDIGGLEQTDDWDIGKANKNDMVRNLRDKQAQMISKIGECLTPERPDAWKQFLNLMEGIAHIPRLRLIKAENIKDIMHILKKDQKCKTRLQACSCLLKILRKIDSDFARHVDPIFNDIVKLDKTMKEIITRRLSHGEQAKLANQTQDVATPPNSADPACSSDICEAATTECLAQECSIMECSLVCDKIAADNKKSRLGVKTDIKQTVNEQCLVTRKKRKRRKTMILKHVRSLRTQSSERHVTNVERSGMMSRLASYDQWPNRSIRTGPLVDGGFSCKESQSTKVECTDCRLVLDASDLTGTNPLEYHMKLSPNCKFVHQDSRSTDGQTQASSRRHTDNQSDNYPSDEESDELKAQCPDFDGIIPNNKHANKYDVSSSGVTGNNKDNATPGAEGGDPIYPISSPRYTEENDRRVTYTQWPHRAAFSIDILVNAGFFYTGDEDIVRCFYCDIGLAEWYPDDDPWVEHARHSPECPYLVSQKGQDYINNIQTQWARMYTPKHPQHAQLDSRKRTFENSGWPKDNVSQTPDQLAGAGFFYTGMSDTVRCFYCDGGLREWEPDDDPWVEHARWFPFCKFVLKIKGTQFIQASANQNNSCGLHTPVGPSSAALGNEDRLTISFIDACIIMEQRDPRYSAAAQSIMLMGYSTPTILMAINSFIDKTGRRNFKAVDLMEIIMEMEEKDQLLTESDAEDHDENKGDIASGLAEFSIETNDDTDDDDNEMALTPEDIKKEVEYLKQRLKCKICVETGRHIVFLPCGHLITDPTDEKEECHADTIPWPEGTQAEDEERM